MRDEEIGLSMNTAIKIKATHDWEGIYEEHRWLERFGGENIDWKCKSQQHIGKNGKHYDLLHIEFRNGTHKTFYFDITSCFGEFNSPLPTEVANWFKKRSL